MKRLLSGFMAAAAVAAMLMVSSIPAFAATYTNSPEQIVCTPYGDLKTQVGLNWVTGKNGSASIVQVIPKTDADFSNAVQYTGDAGDIDNWRWHKVVADNLTPGTTYQYRVGDGSNWSAAREFTTAPAENPENGFTFLNLNDPQASSQAGYNAWTTSLNHAAAKFPGYSFLMHCGDHVDNGANEDQWQWYFEGADPVYSKTIVAGVTGNHDALSGNRYAYRFNYEMPTTSATTQGTYYSFDYANAHFIAINAQAMSDTQQIDWIKYDYAKNAKKWNIVLIHNPLYTNASHYAEVNVRNTFSTILNDQLGADMIFAGHDHIYNRTYPILNNEPLTNSKKLTGQTVNQLTNVTLWDNPAGTVNQVNNCCGIKFYNQNANAETKWFYPVPPDNKAGAQPKTMTYAGITVTDNELVNTAYYTNGSNDTLIESSGILKNAPQINKPQNVKSTYSNNMLRITWEAPAPQSDQEVRQYVIYDENNEFTVKNKTYFIDANANNSVTIAMDSATYNKTNFVVKAIGTHSISEAGVAQSGSDGGQEPEEPGVTNPETPLWVKQVKDSAGTAYTNMNKGISAGSYVTVMNNTKEQVTAKCVLAVYDASNRLMAIRLLPSQEIAAGMEADISIGSAVDTTGAERVKIYPSIDTILPIKPGGMPYTLERN